MNTRPSLDALFANPKLHLRVAEREAISLKDRAEIAKRLSKKI